MKLNQYDIFNTNGNAKARSCVRIRVSGVIYAEVWSDHSNLLHYLRCRPQSVERKALVEQLTLNNVPESDIQMILKLPPKDRK